MNARILKVVWFNVRRTTLIMALLLDGLEQNENQALRFDVPYLLLLYHYTAKFMAFAVTHPVQIDEYTT